jgi:hypothetical protein
MSLLLTRFDRFRIESDVATPLLSPHPGDAIALNRYTNCWAG